MSSGCNTLLFGPAAHPFGPLPVVLTGLAGAVVFGLLAAALFALRDRRRGTRSA